MCCENIYSSWKLQISELCSISESLYWLLTNGIHSSPHFTSRKFPVDTYSARVSYLKLVLQLWIYICRNKQHNAVPGYLKKRNLQSLEQHSLQDFAQYYPFCITENTNGAKAPNYEVRELLRKSFYTVSLYLLQSKKQMQHRQKRGSDRNLCAKFHQHYQIFEVLVRNLMEIQKGKFSEKQEDDKQLGKLENEVLC